jgi:manganese transport protein
MVDLTLLRPQRPLRDRRPTVPNRSGLPEPRLGWVVRLRTAVAFAGPAFLVSVGYMDPGNWGTDLAAGSRYGYQLLWVLAAANLVALFLQHLAARLGIATGRHLADVIGSETSARTRRMYATVALSAMLVTEAVEFLGVVVGLRLLFGMPLWPSVAIGAVVVCGLLMLGNKRTRPLEIAIFALLAVVAVAYIAELFLQPPSGEMFGGWVPTPLPADAFPVAVGILGAVVMPHNLFLHSGLVLSRSSAASNKRRVLRRCSIESGIALHLALLVNAAILILAATTLHNPAAPVETLDAAHASLVPVAGQAAAVVFALALIAAGLASAVTGGIATQYVLDGLVKTRRSLPLLVRRVLAMIPAAVLLGLGVPEVMALVWSQLVLALFLPLVVVPLVLLCRNERLMGELRIGWHTLAVGVVIALAITAVDATTIWGALPL